MTETRDRIQGKKEFLKFIDGTEYPDNIDRFPKTRKCIDIVEDFPLFTPKDHPEALRDLDHLDKELKPLREHALHCGRCQITLEAFLLSIGIKNLEIFPEKIQRILQLEYEQATNRGLENKEIYIGKLHVPTSGTFDVTRSGLGYLTLVPLGQAIREFYQRIQKPMQLIGLTDFETKPKRANNGRGTHYHQAETNHEIPYFHTKIKIRSITPS